MKEKLKEIKDYSKKDIKTMSIVADLGKMTKISDFEPLAEKLKNIDIGILILNAGNSILGPLIDQTPEEIEMTVTINALHPTYLCKVLLDKMLNRKKRSGIIITTSQMGSFPAAGFIPYSAAKAFSCFFG